MTDLFWGMAGIGVLALAFQIGHGIEVYLINKGRKK